MFSLIMAGVIAKWQDETANYLASKFYGLPKVHKQGMPLRPIVSSIGL